MIAKQLEDQKAALEEQKAAIEEERRRNEEEKLELRAQSKAAMNEQITRTMRMFQEQLAQTVKMAAMLQVRWCCGIDTSQHTIGIHGVFYF